MGKGERAMVAMMRPPSLQGPQEGGIQMVKVLDLGWLGERPAKKSGPSLQIHKNVTHQETGKHFLG